MENITVIQIETTLKIIAGIISSLTVIFGIFSMWYKKKIANKFDEVDNKFNAVDNKIEKVEDDIYSLKDKKEKYEKMAQESKEERVVLLEGLLACLESLKQGTTTESVSKAIKKINTYLIDKLRD